MNKGIPPDSAMETPTQVARWVLVNAESYFDIHQVQIHGVGPVNPVRHFMTKAIARKGDNAWKWEKRYRKALQNPDREGVPSQVLLCLVAAGYAIAATCEDTLALPNRAWEYAAKANWYFGLFGGDQDRFESEAFLRRKRARSASEKLHSAPGASRDRQAAIRAAWATGKYSSRDVCAEEESRAIGMSFSAARKALRNTPDPQR